MRIFPVAFLIGLLCMAPAVCGADEFGPEPTWAIPAWQDIRAQIETWRAEQSLSDEATKRIDELWPEAELGPTDSRLDRLAASLAAADSNVAELVQQCSQPPAISLTPGPSWLETETTPDLVRYNMRLYYARWLAQHLLYDEALVAVAGIEPDRVIDPAMLLFFRAVARHQLVDHDAGLKDAQRLLERKDELPARYRHVAELMAGDLKEVEPDSLDHIARRMGDIRRRLDLGRAGKKVRDIEDGVIESLDKLIEELEKQKQQQQQGGGASSSAPSQPAPDSTPMEGKGPGKVDKKDIGSKRGWGSLPPKEREEALQKVGEQFPAHLRDGIEQYFRRIAGEETSE